MKKTGKNSLGGLGGIQNFRDVNFDMPIRCLCGRQWEDIGIFKLVTQRKDWGRKKNLGVRNINET